MKMTPEQTNQKLLFLAYLAAIKVDMELPQIVCLCGSTRFYKEYVQANYDLTMQGKIVLSVGFFGHAVDAAHGQTVGITPAEKGKLDDLHKRKIELADEVYVINVDGYIGDSTRSEIAHAKLLNKPISFLCPVIEGHDNLHMKHL